MASFRLVSTAVHVTLALIIASRLIAAAPMQERLQVPLPLGTEDGSGQSSPSSDDGAPTAPRNLRAALTDVTPETLKNRWPNYESPLFGYSELVQEAGPFAPPSRRKRAEDNYCNDIEADLSQMAPGIGSGALCPYKFKCDYDYNRYPRYIVTAKCLTTHPTDDPDETSDRRCIRRGRKGLKVLISQGNDQWSMDEVLVHHYCTVG